MCDPTSHIFLYMHLQCRDEVRISEVLNKSESNLWTEADLILNQCNQFLALYNRDIWYQAGPVSMSQI
jgi:hypothetical protein